SVLSSLLVISYIVFFFSSRRRHTRSLRDWSSDVCSSDLAQRNLPRSVGLAAKILQALAVDCVVPATGPKLFVDQIVADIGRSYRSEERRVGKSVDLGGRCIMKKKKSRFIMMS